MERMEPLFSFDDFAITNRCLNIQKMVISVEVFLKTEARRV